MKGKVKTKRGKIKTIFIDKNAQQKIMLNKVLQRKPKNNETM